MSLSSLVKRWFGKRQGTIRNGRPGPIQTRKKIGAPRSVKLMLEILEDRLAPATVSYNSSLVELDLVAGAGETISVTTPGSNRIKIQLTNTSDTITLAGEASTNNNFALSGSNATLTINNVNPTSGGVGIGTINVYLPDQQNSRDTLIVGLVNSYNTQFSLNIGAAAGTIPPALPQTDTEDTVTFNNSSLLLLAGQLHVSAETINFQGSPVIASTEMSLTSVNSLTFTPTGVPYTGSVTVNAAPPTGQPFAGDQYITGPDWGPYGYQPGDSIDFTNPADSSSTPTTGTIENIVGNNLYLTSSSPSLTTGNDSYVKVAAHNFVPQIQSPFLTLNVTGPGNSISGAIEAYTLGASTQNGNITLQDVDLGTTPLQLGTENDATKTFETLNAGTGTIQLDVNGAIIGIDPAIARANGFVLPADLIAGAVNLATTGIGASIGSSSIPITTATPTQGGEPAQRLELTAVTNDGAIYISDSSPAGLTINSVVADQMGQTATVSNGQVVYNSTPSSSTPTYIAGDEDVSINSTGPIVLNSVTATGKVTITSGAYILEGDAQSPNVVAPEVDLIAKGAADYQGQVTFANSGAGAEVSFTAGGGAISSVTTTPAAGGSGYPANATFDLEVTGGGGAGGVVQATTNSSGVVTSFAGMPVSAGSGYSTTGAATTTGGDTLTLPATITTSGGSTTAGPTWSSRGFAAGDPITVTGAAAGANNGAFTIASVSDYVLTLTESYVLAPTTQAGVTVGNGMIGSANTAISLSDVPLFSATTANGGIYLALGAGVNSTAVNVIAGGMHGVVNNVSVTSNAAFLTIENILASGNAAVAMNGGSLLEYPSGGFHGFVAGQNVSLTSPYNIGTASDPFLTFASQGLTVAATATSPSSAAINVENLGILSSIGVSTYDGSVNIQYHDLGNHSGSLSFKNNVLAETGNAVVTFTNTDNKGGSADNVIISGTVHVSGISAGISADGTAGAGQILAANSSATIDGGGHTVVLSAGSGIGSPGTFIDVSNVATLDATTTTGGIYIQNTSASPMTLSASTSNGNIDVSSSGDIDLSAESSSMADSVSATGTVTLNSGGAIVDVDASLVYARTLMLTAVAGIGAVGSPLETSSPGTLTLTAAAGHGLYLDNNTALTVNSATAGDGDLSITATGNLTLLGNVSSATSVTLTATDGTLTTGPSSISAPSLTITAEQIGSTSDVVQTNATTINVTANYGGIYLSNKNGGNLTLSAAAVGPILSSGSTNNVEIYSAGNILLLPQSTTLTKLATTLPVAVFNPGGHLILFAGETLSADGSTPPTMYSPATVTSVDAGNDPATYYDAFTGTYDINGSSQFNDNFSTSNGGGLDSNWTVQSGSFTVDTAGQTATATDASASNLATVNSISSVNESVSATISGTLASGQNAGLVALFSSPGTFYYGFIAATSGSSYVAVINRMVGGNPTLLAVQSYNGKVSDAALQFTVVGSSLTLMLNGGVVASATSSNITTPGVVGVVASAGVSFSNFSSAPALQIDSNTPEILVSLPGSPSSANTLLELTASQLAAGVPFIAGTIVILDLGVNGQPGSVTFHGDLILVATSGPITFQNPLDEIDATGTINITAHDVADLGKLSTTANGAISISAGGDISVGTINAGTGTVLITTSSGAVFNSATGSKNLAITAGLVALHDSAQSSVSSAQSANSAASAAQNASIQYQLSAAQAAATAQAAAAEAGADQTTANAFKAALTSIQAAVVVDKQTYQAAVQATGAANKKVSDQAVVVNSANTAVTVLSGLAGVAQTLSGAFALASATSEAGAAITIDIPGLDTFEFELVAGFGILSAVAGLIEGVEAVAASAATIAYIEDSIQLGNYQSLASAAQSAQDQAAAQLQADTDTETAFAVAYNVAEKAYIKALAISNQDALASQKAQQAAVVAEANAAAAAQAAASAAAATAAPTLNVTGPVNIGVAPGASGVNWANSIISSGTVTEQSQGPLTISGVTVQSTVSSVTLRAGGDVDIASSATIKANSTITITANTSHASSGATVTVGGTLSAQSVLIDVDPNATGNETFTIKPSATTQISVDGGSNSSGDNTLNYNAAGLAPTLSETMADNVVTYTITASDVQPVTFTNIEIVNIINAAGGSFALKGLSGQTNAMRLVGTDQGAGTAKLNGLPISFSGMTSFGYQGGGAGDTISVTPFVTSHWNLAVTVDGGSGTPARLTYNSVDSLADTVTATDLDQGSIASQGQALVKFKNVNEITTNASQSAGAQLIVNLPNKSSLDTADLLSVGGGIADINLVGLFGLNVDTADYAGLTINGNTVGPNKFDLATSGNVGLPIPLTLNYPGMHSVVNTGAATTVEATASGDTISVTSPRLVEVTDRFGNDSTFAVTDTQLVLSDLGNNDTINITGNYPFTNGIDVDGNASYSDVINYTTGPNAAAVTVTPSTSTISQTGEGTVFYAGVRTVNLFGSSAATLTVNGAATAEGFDFTQISAGTGSFTVVGPGEAIDASPLFTYTGFGNEATVQLEQLRNQYGFYTTGNYYQNELGLNEKWFKDRSGIWYVIQTNGNIQQWLGGSNLAAPIATVNTQVWSNPNLLLQADLSSFPSQADQNQLSALLQQHGFYTTGNYWQNFLGQNEKWFKDNAGTWWVIQTNGEIQQWMGGTSLGSPIATVNTLVWDDPNLLQQANLSGSLSGSDQTQLSSLRVQYGFYSTGNYWQNFLGQNEKWIQSDTGAWYIIQTTGAIQPWQGGTKLGNAIATVNAVVWANPHLLLQAALNPSQSATVYVPSQQSTTLAALSQANGFHFGGSYDLNFLNMGMYEKWFQDSNNHWYYITTQGTIYEGNGTKFAQVDAQVWDNPNLLFEAKLTSTAQSQLATLQQQYGFQFTGNFLQSSDNLNAKWFTDQHGFWYVLQSNGQLQVWLGSFNGVDSFDTIATVDPQVFADPFLLFGAYGQ